MGCDVHQTEKEEKSCMYFFLYFDFHKHVVVLELFLLVLFHFLTDFSTSKILQVFACFHIKLSVE